MLTSRAASIRSSFRAARLNTTRTRSFRQTVRRGYASSTHEIPNYGSDALWATGAILVTIPPCWYLLSNRAHHHHHESHSRHRDEDEDQDTENDSDNDHELVTETQETALENISGDIPDKPEEDIQKNEHDPTENEEQTKEISITSENGEDCCDVESEGAGSESDSNFSSKSKEQDNFLTSDIKKLTGAGKNVVETENDESIESTKD